MQFPPQGTTSNKRLQLNSKPIRLRTWEVLKASINSKLSVPHLPVKTKQMEETSQIYVYASKLMISLRRV